MRREAHLAGRRRSRNLRESPREIWKASRVASRELWGRLAALRYGAGPLESSRRRKPAFRRVRAQPDWAFVGHPYREHASRARSEWGGQGRRGRNRFVVAARWRLPPPSMVFGPHRSRGASRDLRGPPNRLRASIRLDVGEARCTLMTLASSCPTLGGAFLRVAAWERSTGSPETDPAVDVFVAHPSARRCASRVVSELSPAQNPRAKHCGERPNGPFTLDCLSWGCPKIAPPPHSIEKSTPKRATRVHAGFPVFRFPSLPVSQFPGFPVSPVSRL